MPDSWARTSRSISRGAIPEWEIVALDNLHRPGSELNPARLEEAGVRFVRGDVREPADLIGLSAVTALIECSAEPSAMSGVDGDTAFVFQTNLVGAYNCLELARRDGAFVLFLSTSRVYPVAAAQRALPRGGRRRGSSWPTSSRSRARPPPGSRRSSR